MVFKRSVKLVTDGNMTTQILFKGRKRSTLSLKVFCIANSQDVHRCFHRRIEGFHGQMSLGNAYKAK